MKGTRPGHLPDPSRQTSQGRICAHAGCQTKLSVYNMSDFCWQHAPLAFPNYRGKRLAPGKA